MWLWHIFRPFQVLKFPVRFLFLRVSLQAIDGATSLALYLQLVSQAPQHLTSSETQPTCYGYFSHQSVCSFEPACPRQYIYRNLGRWLSNLDTCWSGLLIPPFTFCSKFIESVSMVGYVHRVTVAFRGNIAESTCDCCHRITRERE